MDTIQLVIHTDQCNVSLQTTTYSGLHNKRWLLKFTTETGVYGSSMAKTINSSVIQNTRMQKTNDLACHLRLNHA